MGMAVRRMAPSGTVPSLSSDVVGGARAPSWYPAAKRTIDLLLALVLLVLIAPVWVLIAIAIRLDSRGPILFRQTRAGRDGQPFTCFKFRTMRSDARDDLHRRFVTELIRAGGGPADGAIFKIARDPRVTRVGHILRKTSLDEVPQLVNVLRGEMSIVGPRPALPYEVEQYEPWHRGRLAGKPGITGIWQVYGRSRVPFDEMVRMDIAYLQRPSLLQDLRLMLLTVPAVLFGDGAV